jgi:hypothetical protein
MWTRSAERVLVHLRPRPQEDLVTHELVRGKLALVCARPERIAVAVEHGCVTLAGVIATDERGRVVRALARVRGVDSVVDLMREEHDQPATGERASRARHGAWPPSRRLAAVALGAGLALVGLRLGGRVGAPLLVLAGVLLAARGARRA